MTDLDRLLELADGASGTDWYNFAGAPPRDQDYMRAVDPDTIIGLIERVKEAESAKRGCEAMLNVGFAKRSELEARLRAAEKVVEAARRFVDYGPWEDGHPGMSLEDALQSYDEAVGRVKEGRKQGTYPNICGALPSTPRKGYCTLLPRHSGPHDSNYGFTYETSNRGYIQDEQSTP